MDLTRRDAMGALAALGAAGWIARGDAAAADEGAGGFVAGTAPGQHQPKALPFDPAKLRGLSERLLVSHHDNNYVGALKNLNKVEEQLAAVTKDTPGFLVSSLRERELTYTNSVILHERYFGNLGGDGVPGAEIASAIAGAFGSHARFEELLRATALSLAGGSGWAILDFSFQTGDLRISGSANHAQALAFGAPLLVLDMYEHSYHLDFGAAAAQYVDAFVANVRWEEVNRRYVRARKAAKGLMGVAAGAEITQ